MTIAIRDVTAFVMMGTAGIMIIAYVIMISHLYSGSGNKNKWLSIMMVLLFLSQVGVLVMGYSFYALFTERKYTMLNIWGFGVGIGWYYMFFNIAHFLLAIKYHKISKEVPLMLNKEE